jgi:hypothetical protein
MRKPGPWQFLAGLLLGLILGVFGTMITVARTTVLMLAERTAEVNKLREQLRQAQSGQQPTEP